MLARWVWSRHWQWVFWGVVWLMAITVISLLFFILKPHKPIGSARPYFTQVQAQISPVKGANPPLTFLTMSVQNNDRPVRNIVHQLLVLDNRLDPMLPPLVRRWVDNANERGRFQNLSQHSAVKVGRNTKSAFVVFEIKYEDASTGQMYSQRWFMKFGGSTRDGTFITTLFDVDQHERAKIESYIKQRGIPTIDQGGK